MSGDTVMEDRRYRVVQHQVYHSGNFYHGIGISVTPAFHFLRYQMNYMVPVYDSIEDSYSFPDTAIRENNFIGFLGVKKDFGIIHAGVFGASANLNEKKQYQAGFELIAYPLSNLDLYLQGQFIAHFNDGESQPVGKVKIGTRLARPVWLELSGSFGEVQNYFENNASSVYNFPDRIRFKYEATLIALLTKRWHLTLDYQYIRKSAGILTYQEINNGGDPEFLPYLRYKDYNDHFLIASILWKL
jgi:hypothetical protein